MYRFDCISTLAGLDDILSFGCPWRYVVGTTSEKKRHTGAKFLIQRSRSMAKLGPAPTNPELTTRSKRP